ncbi:MAG: hypothetical protein JRC93_13960 [Deltaproteobacteria bacterium]|nr:hypothetical protein [Deltaproteobacteria bacterium]
MWQKRLFGLMVGRIFWLTLLVCFFSFETVYAKDEVIKLKCANFFPPPSKQSKLCEDFIHDLEFRTNGRIKVQYFAGGSLLTGPAMYKGIESGIVDMGYSYPNFQHFRLSRRHRSTNDTHRMQARPELRRPYGMALPRPQYPAVSFSLTRKPVFAIYLP